MQTALQKKPWSGKIGIRLDAIFAKPYLYALFALIAIGVRSMRTMNKPLLNMLGVELLPVYRVAVYAVFALVLAAYVLRWLLGGIRRVNPTFLCVLGMFMYLAAITFVFDGISGYHMDWHAGFALMLMMDMGLQREKKSLIRGLTGAFEVWIWLNVISFAAVPQSFSTSKAVNAWLLGNHVFYYRTVLPALVMALVRYQVLGSGWKMRTMLMVLGCMICFVVQNGGTALVGLALLLMLLVWCGRRALPRYITPLTATAAAAVIFVGIYFVEIQRLFSYVITEVLGKSMTMSGRTSIWDRAVPVIMNNPITGVGYLPVAYMGELLGNLNYRHTHNQLLELLLHGGLIATGLYVGALYFASREALAYRRSAAVKYVALVVCVFAVMGIAEMFHNDPAYYALLILLSRADCLAQEDKPLPRISLAKRIGRDLKKRKKA